MRKKRLLNVSIILLIMLCVISLHSEENKINKLEVKNATHLERYEFVHVNRINISKSERLLTFGSVYLVQWASYFGTQWTNIQDNGSFENWYSNMFSVHMDKDSFDFNLVQHSFAGSHYYLFYRSRGYTKPSSLLWSVLSTLMFEFTVETATEPPSVQDIYQTPVLGALLGIGFESLSKYLISNDHNLIKGLGYLINPYAIFSFSSYRYQTLPIVKSNLVGMNFIYSFDSGRQ